MYLRHFALTRLPFETPAHTDELFDSNSRREAEARLLAHDKRLVGSIHIRATVIIPFTAMPVRAPT